MNFVCLSPHFPLNFTQFPMRLRDHGVTVLGLADESYDSLAPGLKSALTEYYRAGNMHNYDELVRALGYFTSRHGKLDRIDSHNEYWLETEARLRTDFNMPGIKLDDIQRVKRKSLMKQTFREAGINVARGEVVRTFEEARKFARETGYPLVAKPDVGVGAASTFRIESDSDLERFFFLKEPVEYILEEYIHGQIVTFDGLTDTDGNPVFTNSLIYSAGIMETVLADDHIYYYTLREVPADIDALGRRVLKAFNVRERFFHFEFFRQHESGEIYALEVNMRPPGGFTVDMFNYACDIDMYNGWASIMAGKGFPYPGYSHKYFCCYVGRKFNRPYLRSHEEVLAATGEHLCQHEEISGVFSRALGHYGYILRTADFDEMIAMAEFIQA